MKFFEIAIFAIPGLTLIAAMWHTYKAKKARIAARWGACLIAVGCIAALVAAFVMQSGYDQVQTVFVTNFLLIVASLGGGLLGSAATVGLER